MFSGVYLVKYALIFANSTNTTSALPGHRHYPLPYLLCRLRFRFRVLLRLAKAQL